MYCKECGTEINGGKFCKECGTAVGEVKKDIRPNNYDPLQLNPKYLKWIGSLILSLAVFGVLNFIFAPLAGVILIIFAALIYVTKSINVISVFGVIWLLLTLYQLYLGLYFSFTYMFLALINGVFSIYILYKVNQFKKVAEIVL